MNEEYILKIISYGLDGNACGVSGFADMLERDLRREGKTIIADRIKNEARKARPLSPFMQGWWNSFSAFAAEILTNGTTGTSQEQSCFNILRTAGITEEEANTWLNTEEAEQRKNVSEIIRNYIDTL